MQPQLAEISRADFEASIERKIDFAVPYDLKAATQSAKLGQTFAEANRATKAGAVLRELGEAVYRAGDADAAANAPKATAKKSLLGKIDIKSMLAKKSKTGVPA